MEGTHFKEFAKGGSIKRKIVNPDLQEERDKCNFDQEEVEQIINLPGFREYHSKIIDVIEKNPHLMQTNKSLEMTRDELMKHQWTHINKIMDIDPTIYHSIMSDVKHSMEYNADVDPCMLHYGMF